MSFRTILEHKTIEGKFAFINVGECIGMADCINYLHNWYPDYTIEKIEPIR